jgi:hypothetical protein
MTSTILSFESIPMKGFIVKGRRQPPGRSLTWKSQHCPIGVWRVERIMMTCRGGGDIDFAAVVVAFVAFAIMNKRKMYSELFNLLISAKGPTSCWIKKKLARSTSISFAC